jgi:hypothetical protein
MTTFIIHTEDKEQTSALKDFLQSLKLKFEMNTDEKKYNAEFVAKIDKSKKEIEEGKGIKINAEDIDDLWK